MPPRPPFPRTAIFAFLRGGIAGDVYIKALPNGAAKRLTADPRLKYGLAFSPGGTRVAYSVLQPPSWDSYTVSVLGGEPILLLRNAAAPTWLSENQILFSTIRGGLHMGIVTSTVARENLRDLYFPPHERAMAHYSFASPDLQSALVVEIDETGGWGPCRRISLNSSAPPRLAGPLNGACTSAAWSSNGAWMYFSASVEGRSHI